ncbi:MAG: hypothetical protein AB4368_04490 [Xenococcaceae cyanobacterium]
MPSFVQAVCALQLQDEGMEYDASLYYAKLRSLALKQFSQLRLTE